MYGHLSAVARCSDNSEDRHVARDKRTGTVTSEPWMPLSTATDALPLYHQVTETIAREIEEGRLSPGSMLPPELELVERFGVSRHTVRAGIAALVRAGILDRQRGKGTVVRRPRIQQSLARFYSLAHEMRARGTSLETLVLERGRLRAGDALAEQACHALELDDPEAIGYLRRLRLVDGTPLLTETLAFPAALCPALLEAPMPGEKDVGAAPFYDVLATRAGITVSRARETLRPEVATGELAHVLGVPEGTPVFHVERTSTAGDQPVEWRRALVRGDRFSYTVDLLNPVEEGDPG